MAPNSQIRGFSMGMDNSLQDIMNDVSRRLDTAPSLRPQNREVLSEMQAFILLDPLLADLNKEYLDAKRNRLNAAKDFGGDDGMTELAGILEDSAWCAMQTRYMEVRADRFIMVEAQRLMEESRLQEARLAKKDKERQALYRLEQMQLFARMRELRQQQNIADLWMLIFMMGSTEPHMFRNHNASYPFNRLAA